MSEEKRPRVIKETRHVNYDNPAAAGTTDICTAQNLVEDTALSIDGVQPDVPRSLVLTVVDTSASITEGDIEVVGLDQNGTLIQEDVDISAGAGTYNTSNAFSVIKSITPNGVATLGGAGDETLSVGSGTKLGLPGIVNGKLVEVFKTCVDGADEAVGTVDKTYGTLIPTTAANGTRDYDVWYTVEFEMP